MMKTPQRELHNYISEISERADVRAGSPLPLGTQEWEGGVNFAIFSRHASRVRLELFDHPGDPVPARATDLDSARNRTGDVWHVWVEGICPGQLYAYRVDGATTGRVILGHLGNGASLAAVRDGQSLDTSMSFTPTAGVPMSTRSGDLDPGLVWYLARTEKMSAKQFNEMVNFQSGLLGVSETSFDMRDLLDRETQDVRAAEAVALFCYQVKKLIGAFAAALGGLDTLVFAGGIGENAPAVRARICDGLGFLGIGIDEKRNAANEGVISAAASRVAVRVIRTDEERMIAKTVCLVLGLG